MSANNREHILLSQLEEVKTIWEEKLGYLEKEFVFTSSADQQFGLRKKIEECRKEISRIAKEIESLKKESQQKNSDILDSLFQRLHDIPIIDRVVEVFGKSQKTEPVVAAHWQEFMRFWIFKLGRKNNQSEYLYIINADDVILRLLTSNRSPRESRALSSFAMQCLTTELEFKDETVDLVINKAIDNLNDLDGFNNKLNTSMDEAFHYVMQSPFGNQLYERLLQSYVQACEDHRNKIGCIFLNTAITNTKILNAENANQILTPLLEKLTISGSLEQRVDAALRLVETFYRPQVQKNATQINFLPDVLLRMVVKVLLTAVEQETTDNYAVSTTAIWAIVWLTSAKTCYSYTTYIFADRELDILRQVIINKKHDAFARSYSALVLSVCSSEKTIFAQADWIYEWAVVADGAKPQRNLPKISHLNRPTDIEVMKNLIYSQQLPIQFKKNVAIGLGRLGCFIPEIVEPLLQVFLDETCDRDRRDEALVYLVFIGNSEVISELIKGVKQSPDDTDGYGVRDRCFLALIGMGNVAVLKYQLELAQPEADKSYINSYAYALAGVDNPLGRKVLESLKNHKIKEISTAVLEALRQSKKWNS